MALFSGAAAEFWLRWVHYVFGILWIGHLYYFNFSQTPFMAEADAATKSQVFQKLTPHTMFWFRWGAMLTFLTGWAMIAHKMGAFGIPLNSAWSTIILSGGIIGTLMFLNVWLIIWPITKLAIENATRVAKGESPIAGIAEMMPRAAIASRTNTLFSLPTLFFMAAASHLPLTLSPEKSLVPYWCTFAIIIGLLQFNAIKGKMGPMRKLGGVIHFGVLLTLILYFAMEFLAG
jgi:uncharacterized membrane protein